MNAESDQKPILIYYKFRGQAQPIRNFFCYLAIPFIEIHLQRFEQQKKNLPFDVLQKVLNKFKLDRSQLPSLIHQDYLIQGALPLMTYVCKRYGRHDLLGSDMRTRARLQQILQIYFIKQPQSMLQLFSMAQFASKNSCKQQIDHFIRKNYQNLMNTSKYIKEICQMLDMQQNPKFVLREMTLIDFFFLQTCFYMLGMYYCKQRLNFEELRLWNPQTTHFLEKPNAYYIKVMETYLNNIINEPFYAENKEYLQSHSIISAFINEERTKGLRQVWLGNNKFVL